MDLMPLPGGGLVVGAGDPGFGAYDAGGKRTLWRGPETADMRRKRGRHFAVSPDGRALWFGLEAFSETPVRFDLATRRLTDAPERPAGFALPETGTLTIKDWEDATRPTLASAPLALEPYETAFSFAIAPDATSFILGTEWQLRRFDAQGAEAWAQPVPGVAWGVNLARGGRLVIAAHGDATIRWHRADTGEEVLALFIHLPDGPAGTAPEDREWILFTPEGYFDASSERAERLIGWHVNRGEDKAPDFHPAGTFAETFRRPARIDAALEGL